MSINFFLECKKYRLAEYKTFFIIATNPRLFQGVKNYFRVLQNILVKYEKFV